MKNFHFSSCLEFLHEMARRDIAFFEFISLLVGESHLVADHVRCPVAPSPDGVERQVGGALVDPAHDAGGQGPPRAGDKLAAGAGVGEHANVVTLGGAVGVDGDLQRMLKQSCITIYVMLLMLRGTYTFWQFSCSRCIYAIVCY